MFGFGRKKKQQKQAQAKIKRIIPLAEREAVLHKAKTAERQTMAFYRARYENYQAQLKQDLAGMGMENIVPLHYTYTVFTDPVLSEFLLDIGLDPYLRWNTFYCTHDVRMAMLTDCRLVPPPGQTQLVGIENPQDPQWGNLILSAEICRAVAETFDQKLREAAGLWQEAQKRFMLDGDIMTFSNVRDYILVTIAQMSGDIERITFPGQPNMVHRLLDQKRS